MIHDFKTWSTYSASQTLSNLSICLQCLKNISIGLLVKNEQTAKPLQTSKMSAESQGRDEPLAVNLENGVAESEKPRTEPTILSSAEEDAAGKVYPPTREVIPVMVALFMALFLVSLVNTQIPRRRNKAISNLINRTALSLPPPFPSLPTDSTLWGISVGTQVLTCSQHAHVNFSMVESTLSTLQNGCS